MAILGDSIGVGVGDPLPGGGWRGYAPLLAEAFGTRLVNLAFNGARVGCVRTRQLPEAVDARPDAAVVFVGMNDTMRSDFDPARMHEDLDHIVSTLTEAGTIVLAVRYHDPGRVFRIPGPLRRALVSRIATVNTILDTVSRTHGAQLIDLDRVPEIYQAGAWAVDRLHPSELGHRMLARLLAERLAAAGAMVHGEVSLACSGGRPIRRYEHYAWLVVKGIPWLFRRGGHLVRYGITVLLRAGRVAEASASAPDAPSRTFRTTR